MKPATIHKYCNFELIENEVKKQEPNNICPNFNFILWRSVFVCIISFMHGPGALFLWDSPAIGLVSFCAHYTELTLDVI